MLRIGQYNFLFHFTGNFINFPNSNVLKMSLVVTYTLFKRHYQTKKTQSNAS